MKKMTGLLCAVGLLAALSAQAAAPARGETRQQDAAGAAQGSPSELVKQTVNEVMGVIKRTKDQRKLREAAEEKVLPHFDFTRMTQLAVGRHWRQASPEQRKALEDAFRTLLVSTYTTALSQSASTDYEVEVSDADHKPGEKETTVRTLVKRPGRQPVSIDYRMALESGAWKVYDVVVENLSLVTNYRSSFNSQINRSGIDGLIKSIEAKNQKTSAG